MSTGAELSPIPEAKKRPPPITIPAQPPSRLVPGPNILAMSERAEREEAERQAGNAFYQQAKRSACSTPKSSPADGSHLPLPLPLRTDSHASKDKQRTSGMSTFTHFIDHARSGMSPRKSEVSGHASSTTSRHGSTAQSRYSEHSHRSRRSTHQLDDNGMTSRADIEGRAEKKLFKMMGQIPSTPTFDPEGVYLTTYDLSSKGSKKKPEEHIKSPKKKLFGVTLPGFMSSVTPTPSINESMPPMPSKAAQVLGATPVSKRRKSPEASKTPRSDTSKSLPSKIYDQHSHGRRPNTSGSTRTRPRAPSRKTHSPIRDSPVNGIQWQGVDIFGKPGASLDLGAPPTPPQKDTPPQKGLPLDNEENVDLAYIHPAFRTTAADEEENEFQDLFVDGGMRVQLPYLKTTSKPIPLEGGESPSKFLPYGAEDYAKLIESERVESTHALFDYAPSGIEDGNHSVPLDVEKQALETLEKGRWCADDKARYGNRLSQRLSDRLRELPPAFYSPSSYAHSLFEEAGRPSNNTDQKRLLFAFPPNTTTAFSLDDSNRGDIGVSFEDTPSVLDQNSNMSKMINVAAQESASPCKSDELRLSLAREPQGSSDHFSGRAGRNGYLQPEQSSSRLTDILSGVSPSKTDFNHDFFANCPSAVPSPLHRMPGQQMPGQQMPEQHMRHPMTGPPPEPMGNPHSLTWAQHFHMTNEHIDVSGRTLYDFVAECNHEQIVASNLKHDKTVATLEERFHDIKLHLDSFNNEVDRAHNQIHSIDEKLDKLLDFIKTEVVEPLTVQSKKTADMETIIQALQKSMFNLEQSVETKLNPAPDPGPGPSACAQYPLPHHRSQPSLVGGLYEPPNDANQTGSSRLASIQEAANGGRFRYQNWNRTQTNGRENNKDMQHPFTVATNNYSNGAGNYGGANGGGGGYIGGYPGYPYAGTPQQSYNYNQGAPK